MDTTKAIMRIKISDNARICDTRIEPDGSFLLLLEIERMDKNFRFVEASKLSLEDEFLSYEPRTKEEKEFKKLLIKTIKKGVGDFYCQKMSPSFDELNKKIYYQKGQKIYLDGSYNWWEKAARDLIPDKNSRLGTMSEHIAFIGVLMKKMIEQSGYSVSEAWKMTCNLDSSYAERNKFPPISREAGSDELCGFFDLTGTYKYLKKEQENDIRCAGGQYDWVRDRTEPMATYHYCGSNEECAVGWIVHEI